MGSKLLSLLLPAILGMAGCTMAARPADNSRLRNDVARMYQDQQDLSRRVVQLENNMVLMEGRLQSQQRTTNELKQMMATQKVTGPGQKTEPATTGTPPVSSVSPTELYLQAFSDYAAGNYSKAIQGFEAFVRNYPGNDYAGNAQYWLGECYYGLENYQQAVQELRKVGEQYPESGKAPDALLKMVPALKKLNRFEQARKVLEDLVRLYPESPAAQKAMAGF